MMTTIKPINRRGRPTKTRDNRTARSWLLSYDNRWEFCTTNPRAEDVLTGAARLRTAGDTGRGLSVKRLFTVLRGLDTITTAGVAGILFCARQTAEVYAAAARVASRALEPLAVTGPSGTFIGDFSADEHLFEEFD